ncbi:uncharacterized protein [Spinacia oleracea]|uniref:Reverse transcriptase zinc-binding domain-containing protein n=1 Tax=Spinacia oleracea TaxID=3562 RepID=A0A9R0JXJ4_SPIOL|nr:uncharacterized protein LOC110790285 [Spinacia oleracea]
MWKTRDIWEHFDQGTARDILSIHIPEDDHGDDIEWWPNKNGQFTVKSGYWFLQNGQAEKEPNGSKFWKSWWKANLWPKWKILIWKIIHNAIPTRDNLRHRHIDVPSTCPLCEKFPETPEHLFMKCELAKHLWSASYLGINSDVTGNGKARHWVRNFLSLLMREDKRDASRLVEFVSIIWSIWLARNDAAFNSTKLNPSSIMLTARCWKNRWKKAFEGTSSCEVGYEVLQVSGAPRLVWERGRDAVQVPLIVETDGAWKKLSHASKTKTSAAVGWCFRRGGRTVAVGDAKCFASSPDQSEALAILHAISAVPHGTEDLVISTDSANCVLGCINELSAPSEIQAIIKDIKKKALGFNSCIIQKVSRDSVKRAHILATNARKVP